MKKNKKLLQSALVSLLVTAFSAQAAVSGKEAVRLGKDLTPIGAERSGNKDGTIPAWNGGIKDKEIPKGFVKGKHHINPFSGDKQLFTITAKNYQKYSDQLSAGQVELFKIYPDTFAMPVYQTRRTARQPERIYANTYKAATNAKLLDGGNGFSGGL